MSKYTARITKRYNSYRKNSSCVPSFREISQEDMILKLQKMLKLFQVNDVDAILKVANQKKLEIITYEIENYFEVTFKLKFENEDSWTEFNLLRKRDTDE